MIYLLDTDTCIFLLNKQNDFAEQKLRQLNRTDVGISTITFAELCYGAIHSKKKESNQKRIEIFCSSLTLCTFDQKSAILFGNIKEHLIRSGEMIGIMDLLIASVALSKKATLVTHNLSEFKRVPQLQLEDWF